MAKLSCALVDQAKASNDVKESEGLRQEALLWAEKAVETAPGKPFGHMALSVASSCHNKRMQALRKATDLSCGCHHNAKDITEKSDVASTYPSISSGTLLILVRLLVEPREEEARSLRCMSATNGNYIAKASPKHPLRRELDRSEKDLYDRIRHASVCLARSTILETRGVEGRHREEMEVLSNVSNGFGWTQYRLGVFFRKMQPEEVYRPQSQFHFRIAVKSLHENSALSKKAQFWLATFGVDDVLNDGNETSDEKTMVNIDRCPEEYVVSLYSTFARKFDDLLVNKLNYRTPQLLRELVDSSVISLQRRRVWAERGADLGCGTGLSGVAFRNCISELTGVDLSPEMIEKARDRGCYNNLVVGDVESILHGATPSPSIAPRFEIIFACDVFVYIGDLRSVFASVRQSLSLDGGIFAFSTELLEEDASAKKYVLHPCARFSHKRSYICELAREFDFKCNAIEVKTIRKNQGKDVKGILAVMSIQEE
uniref:Methyltransferase type 12 domain-containing protein n=1 Tax=Odontella aurita TaxID=265563 RepID=A0A7S4HHC3_9STRA|mmetsp:Transcript_10020/g.29646  ORF Transcript_10020/g.29646 Transcript_10020/m.29646 type:complete len:485 (+) Transcript_10020:114-1568(+)